MSWLFGRRSAPAPDVRPAATPPPVSFHDAMDGHLRGLVRSTRQSGAYLPVRGSVLLFAMLDALGDLLDHTALAPPTLDEQIAVEFMIRDYIPSTVNAFFASRAPQETKDALLVEQLELLESRVRSMVAAIDAHDNAQLEINGRFLHEKFG